MYVDQPKWRAVANGQVIFNKYKIIDIASLCKTLQLSPPTLGHFRENKYSPGIVPYYNSVEGHRSNPVLAVKR